jgi:hypothetical protein
MEWDSHKRFWRRVGWGAQIGFILLVAVILLCLQFGPPRDSRCFQLDREDFGLGYLIGADWNVSAFRQALQGRFADVDINEGYPWGLAPQQKTVMLDVDDGKLYFHLVSSEESVKRTLEAVDILQFDVLSSFSLFGATPSLSMSESVQRQLVRTGGITLGSREDEVRMMYGRPLTSFSFFGGMGVATYLGNRQTVTFMYTDSAVTFISVSQGYRGNLRHRLLKWREYLYAPLRRRELWKLQQQLQPGAWPGIQH